MDLTIVQSGNHQWSTLNDAGMLVNVNRSLQDAIEWQRRLWYRTDRLKGAGLDWFHIQPTEMRNRGSIVADTDVEIDAGVGKHICDFCSDPYPVWNYECPDYVVEEYPEVKAIAEREKMVSTSRGNWAACGECARLIENKNWPFLAKRSALQIKKRYPDRELKQVVDIVSHLQRTFKEHYTTKRVPYHVG